MDKILICGPRGVGKSTLIRRLLAESTLPVGGFVTRRLTQADGDGMFPIYLHAAALPPEERPYDPEHLVGTCDSRRSIRYPEAFDRLGPPLLTSGGLLVMDELGFLENDAHRFQAAVLAAWLVSRGLQRRGSLSAPLWQVLGGTDSVFHAEWPECDPEKMKDDEKEIAVQINGRVRATITVPADISKEDAIAAGKEAIKDKLTGNIVKEIYVPGRIVNIVMK